ncbi:MAG: phosphotransferase family protein [Deltaproteobacteria bacterium]|nr:phosphotransferase family protein [Deltaproteobacteria bacterium]
MSLPDELRAWIEAELRAPLASTERVGAGASRATWLVRTAQREVVLRLDTGDGPVAGTELSLAREAAAYRALRGARVRIPALIASRDDALLVERAGGSPELDALSSEQRAALMLDFAESLAELHLVDARKLELPGFARPRAPRDHALNELALWRRIFESRVKRPAPLARFAFAWLERNAPEASDTVLCHGDVGPGNFLHDGARVTALLDWEFAHVGDPMDDLGWLAFRGHHMQADIGDLGAQLARWSSRTGWPVSPARVAYYRAFVMLRWLVSCLAALDNGAKSLDRSVYFSLIALVDALLPRALAQLAGIALPAFAPAPAASDRDSAEAMDALVSDIATVLMPALTGEAQRRARGALLLAMHAAALARFGETANAAEREALRERSGRAPTSLTEGRLAVDALTAAAPASEDAAWLAWLARVGEARLVLWPMVANLAKRPLADIPVVTNP